MIAQLISMGLDEKLLAVLMEIISAYNIEERIAKELYGDIVYKCWKEKIQSEKPDIIQSVQCIRLFALIILYLVFTAYSMYCFVRNMD